MEIISREIKQQISNSIILLTDSYRLLENNKFKSGVQNLAREILETKLHGTITDEVNLTGPWKNQVKTLLELYLPEDAHFNLESSRDRAYHVICNPEMIYSWKFEPNTYYMSSINSDGRKRMLWKELQENILLEDERNKETSTSLIPKYS